MQSELVHTQIHVVPQFIKKCGTNVVPSWYQNGLGRSLTDVSSSRNRAKSTRILPLTRGGFSRFHSIDDFARKIRGEEISPGLKFSQKFQPNRAKSRNPKTVEGPKNGRNRRSAIPGVPGFVCTRSAYVRRALKRFDHRMIDANNRYPQNRSLWATLLKAHNHNSVPDF